MKSPWVWLSFITLSSLIFFFWWHVNKDPLLNINIDNDYKLYLGLFFEALTLLIWFKLQLKRDSIIVENCQKNLHTNEKELLKLKELWFKSTIDIKNSSYLEIAESIDRFMDLKEKHKSAFKLDKNQLISLIFSNESKSRVLILFMGFSAGVIVLSISAGSNINSVFGFFESLTTKSSTLLFLIFPMLTLLSSLLFKFIFLLFNTALENKIDDLDGLNAISKKRTSIFINQLISLHSLKKARIKCL